MEKRRFSVSTKPTTQPSFADPARPWREFGRGRLTPSGEEHGQDAVAVEEPLEVRVRGTALAVLMRMPGRERDLVAGFLAAEGVVGHGDDLLKVEPCINPDTGKAEHNIWNAALAEGVAFDPRSARFGTVSASCGLCGTRTLEELEQRIPGPVRQPEFIPAPFFNEGFQRMRQEQDVFRRTAGVHAAALLRPDREWLDMAEDVGRHNAVDKVLGARLLQGDYPLGDQAVLLVSGRVSFEIVQKAALAGVGLVAGVSAPTSLAVESAERFGVALFGMVREQSANRYSGSTRML